MPELTFRHAEKKDCALILRFIRELAVHEEKSDEVVTTEALLREWMFEKKGAEGIFGCVDGKEAAFALYYHTFSAYLGRIGIHMEELIVLPEYRGKGYGKALLQELARLTAEKGYGRLEWQCLNWNQSGNAFYLSLGAEQFDDWYDYRAAGDVLRKLAEGIRTRPDAGTVPAAESGI